MPRGGFRIGAVGKIPVIGIRERGGRTKAYPIAGTESEQLQEAICQNIASGSMLHTDDHRGYQNIDRIYNHKVINHSAREYARDGVSTNSIESVWAVLKRGLHGVYHHASKKHLFLDDEISSVSYQFLIQSALAIGG
jgi:transposase-like protein